jgi:YbbR domain-containing protein
LIGRKVDLYLAKQLSTGVVTADLSNLTEGTHKINLEYKSSITSVSYKLDPSTVNITIYPKVSKTQTLTTEIINEDKLDSKLSISSVTLDTDEIVINGAEHTLNSVATVKALVDVSKIVDPKTGVTSLDDVKLVAYDTDGNVVDVETVPNKVTASISIESPSKELPIKVVPTGSVEFGKAINSITSSVTKVTVYGNKDVLDKLEYIPVEIDVTDLNTDKDYTVIISKPSGIKEISETSTEISVQLGTEVSKEVDDVLIETLNLDSNYKVLAIGESSSKTTVIVKGTQSVVDAIDSSMIKATVDLSGYKEGDYEVSVQVSGDDEKATYASKTTKIKIRIQEK